MNTLLENLNPEQIQPVLQTEGPVLVLAGAGSGKTRVLTSRIAHLVTDKGVNPASILAITFTNKAAGEMKERISSFLETDKMWVCTIHSMCVRILRSYASSLGMGENFSIYSEVEKTNVIKQSFLENGLDDEKLLKNVKWHISNAKMLGLSPEEYEREYAHERTIQEISRVYARYNAHLRQNNAYDFDDLLVETRRLLSENEEAREYYAGKFCYILVDEFQDTNAVQFDIIRILASVHKNLFAVGDDDQSIYGWRGAKIENILNFEKSFPDAKVYKLEQNYRSTKEILSLANAVIHHNGKRKDKTLWTENEQGSPVVYHAAESEADEALFVAAQISKLMREGAKLSDFAVLMRINALTRSFEQEFTKYGLSYKVFGGFRFFERKEIKDILAYLRIVNNPFDSEAVLRVINVPRRGIGDKTIGVLQDYAAQNNLTVYDALWNVEELPLNSSTKSKLKDFSALIDSLVLMTQNPEETVETIVKELLKQTKMKELYEEDQSEEGRSRVENINEYENSVEEYCRLNEGAGLADYLNQVTLSTDTDEMDSSEYVTLATIHAVKGLEFKNVFVCGLEENIMPTSRAFDDADAMEEERRLMYVAVTRAKKRLFLTRAKSRYLYGKRDTTSLSLFLKEVKDVLGIKDEPVYKRYDGDYRFGSYDDTDSYFSRSRSSYGSSYGSNYGGRGSYRSAYEDSYGERKAYGGRNDEDFGSSFGGSSFGGSSFGGGSFGSGVRKESSSISQVKGFQTMARNAPQKKNDVSCFRVGVKVTHPKFGEGIVTGVRGAADSPILEVKFTQAGVKQLSAALAPLTIIR